MSEIESWYKECNKVYDLGEYNFVIVNGFKITHYLESNTYTLQDTRFNDFYTSVSEEDLSVLRKFGFIDGSSIITHQRNINRVELYLQRIADTVDKKLKAKKLINTNQKFYSKQIRNCDINIHKYNDMVHFYKSKVEQFKSRFLILTKTENNE